MSAAVFIKLTATSSKGAGLIEAVAAMRTINAGTPPPSGVGLIETKAFRAIPRSPFAYWTSKSTRGLFLTLPAFECDSRTVRQGLATGDDNRFLRQWSEVSPARLLTGTPDDAPETFRNRTRAGFVWAPLAKGGNYAPWFADLDLVLNWSDAGAEVRNLIDPESGRLLSRPQSVDFYFRPALTYPLRAHRLNPWPLPAGAIISVRGSGIMSPRTELTAAAGLMSSAAFDFFVKTMLGRFGHPQFDMGTICRTPIPADYPLGSEDLGRLAGDAIDEVRCLSTSSETAHLFFLPALLQAPGSSLSARAICWQSRLDETDRELAEIQAEIDDVVFDLYGLEEEDRRAILESLGESGAEAEADADAEEAEPTAVDARALVLDLLSYCVGVSFGRFDVRCATGELAAPELPDPFAPLPACSPGMLTGEDGLPLGQEPAGYPLRVSWDGVLVDDLGFKNGRPHEEDIVARVREVLALLFGSQAEEIEHEACELLGAKTLRDFFAKPSGFFAEHLKRYSKSRRQAPIYWPLSTTSGSYTLWLYYHRLSDDLLYTAVNRYVEPKAGEVQRRLNAIAATLPTATGKQAGELRNEHEELTALQGELADLREELLRVAALPYKPDLDDGVLICASPLARLFRLTKWRKDLEACWKKLERGDYDWAHLAYAIWPERVLEACRHDRSIAIAHGVEEGTAE
jgi:hypothetical protein